MWPGSPAETRVRWATPAPACSPSVSALFSPPAATTAVPPGPPPTPRKGTRPAQGSSSLPTTGRRGGFPCLLRWVSPGPAGKACLASDGESGTSGPDEGCLCGEDMPELALLGVGWRRGPTQSPPIRRGCDPHPSPISPTKYMQINANICYVSSPPGPAPARGECRESFAKACPLGGSLTGGS